MIKREKVDVFTDLPPNICENIEFFAVAQMLVRQNRFKVICGFKCEKLRTKTLKTQVFGLPKAVFEPQIASFSR